MKKYICLILLIVITRAVYSQYNETIRTARPGQAVGPFTTGKNILQIQTGLTYAGFDQSETNLSGNNTEYATSLRYGILEDFEIRSAFRLRSDQVKLDDAETNAFGGLSFWNVGVRYNFKNGNGYEPSFGLQTDIKLNWVDENYNAEEIAPRIMLIHGQKLSDTFGLTTNWVMSWNGNNNEPKGGYVINLSFPISGKWSGFVENYGEVSNSDLDMRWDTGLAYLVNNDFQLDLSTGLGNNNSLTDWFIDGGISWRIKMK